MTESIQLREKYLLSGCCHPRPHGAIVGYFSHDDFVKVHASDCPSLDKAEEERLVTLKWDDILIPEEPGDNSDTAALDHVDRAILRHHAQYGIDYSHVIARKLGISKEEAFDRHRKLRDDGLIERVEARMVQYRKGIVDNKWIKHRNHTYYDLTDKGRRSLQRFDRDKGSV